MKRIGIVASYRERIFAASLSIPPRGLPQPLSVVDGILTNWEQSEAFDVAQRDPKTQLIASEM